MVDSRKSNLILYLRGLFCLNLEFFGEYTGGFKKNLVGSPGLGIY